MNSVFCSRFLVLKRAKWEMKPVPPLGAAATEPYQVSTLQDLLGNLNRSDK
jgi:hypothetical protein